MEMSDIRQKENSLIVAYDKAAHILKKSEPDNICKKTGTSYEKNRYKIKFMDSIYEIQMPEVSFLNEKVPIIVQVLILHYMTTMENQPVRGEFINFSSIPGGMFYFRSFKQRALDKLISTFEGRPEKLLSSAKSLGGDKWTTGEYSSIIPIFPKINMVVQYYKGDDEFPPEANILFSDSIVNFLPVEDTAFLGGYLAGTLEVLKGESE